MASKRGSTKGAGAASADNEIDELFSGIGDKNTQSAAAGKTPVSAKPKPGDDILAELESELGEKPKAPSRPHTPRVAVGAATKAPAARPSLDEPKSTTSTTAVNLPRKSVESARGAHAASFTPSATSSELQESERIKGTVEQQQQQQHQEQQAPAAGGGWWGGILSTATAAMKQAEAAVKEIQQNEEAKKYLESVRGNVGALRGLGKSHSIHNVHPKRAREMYAVVITRDCRNSLGTKGCQSQPRIAQLWGVVLDSAVSARGERQCDVAMLLPAHPRIRARRGRSLCGARLGYVIPQMGTASGRQKSVLLSPRQQFDSGKRKWLAEQWQRIVASRNTFSLARQQRHRKIAKCKSTIIIFDTSVC